ncbi:MAG: glycosyltransferase family 2 protein [Desulfopila sp.]|nr:glycosyltransferase family 2 protein [Desulfopila sp.]
MISVITIVLNGENELRQTINSVLQQTYERVEYIVIDGGSADGTVAILKEYEPHLAYWSSEKDKGISDAFNKGIARAKGEIVGLINAGDWYEPDTLEQVAAVFQRDKSVDVVCGTLQFWKGKCREYLCTSVPQLLECEMSVTHPTCFVRKESYSRAGLFSLDYKMAMDYEMLLRLKKLGCRFVSLNCVLANMQHYGVSEENWQAALHETHRARKALLGSSFYTTIWYYWFLYLKRRIRLLLEELGWERVLRFYRKRIALVKKFK